MTIKFNQEMQIPKDLSFINPKNLSINLTNSVGESLTNIKNWSLSYFTTTLMAVKV